MTQGYQPAGIRNAALLLDQLRRSMEENVPSCENCWHNTQRALGQIQSYTMWKSYPSRLKMDPQEGGKDKKDKFGVVGHR